MPAVPCRKERETVEVTLRIFATGTISGCMQVTVIFLGFAVLVREEGGEEMGGGEEWPLFCSC